MNDTEVDSFRGRRHTKLLVYTFNSHFTIQNLLKVAWYKLQNQHSRQKQKNLSAFEWSVNRGLFSFLPISNYLSDISKSEIKCLKGAANITRRDQAQTGAGNKNLNPPAEGVHWTIRLLGAQPQVLGVWTQRQTEEHWMDGEYTNTHTNKIKAASPSKPSPYTSKRKK